MSDILTQQEFFDFMKSAFIAGQTKITDLNVGSALYTQLFTIAGRLNQVMVKAQGGFKKQFEQIPYSAFNFQRNDATTASATVVFSRAVATSEAVNIGSGTIVGTSGGLLYTTAAVTTIASGATDSGAVEVVANDSGSAYNVQVGVINVINTAIDGVNSVTNNTAAAGGTDKESNADYFARFTNFILGLSGSDRYGIWTAAVSVDTIQSAYVQDHFPPESGVYNFTIYVDDGSGSVPQSVLDEVYLVVYGNDTSEYQGYAAAGINFRVLTAGLVPVTVVYDVDIDATQTTSSDIQTQISDIVTNYINALWVGSDVIWSEIIRQVKGIFGITSITSITLNGSQSDVTIAANQVARVSTVSSA